MKHTQPPLIPPPEPSQLERDLLKLIAALDGRGWVKRKVLRRHLRPFSLRYLRRLADESRGQVLSWPGSPGYILTREANTTDPGRAARALRSQAKRMDERAREILRVHHSLS